MAHKPRFWNVGVFRRQSERSRPALTLDSIRVDARLTRRQAAKALTDCGNPVSPKTLSTKASRGGGPPYQLFGKIAIYTWGTLVAWALAEMGEPARSASEHRIKFAGGAADARSAAGGGAEGPRKVP